MSNNLETLYTFHAVMSNSTVPTVDSHDAVTQLVRAALRGEPIEKLHVEKLADGKWVRYAPADQQFATRLQKERQKRAEAAAERTKQGKPARNAKNADTIEAALRNHIKACEAVNKMDDITPDALKVLESTWSAFISKARQPVVKK